MADLKDATPRPWEVGRSQTGDSVAVVCKSPGMIRYIAAICSSPVFQVTHANAALIVEAVRVYDGVVALLKSDLHTVELVAQIKSLVAGAGK